MDDEAKKQVAAEFGRQGGLITKKKYGKKHYQKLAENMNKIRKEKKAQALEKK